LWLGRTASLLGLPPWLLRLLQLGGAAFVEYGLDLGGGLVLMFSALWWIIIV
jgi:hypothetical protein